jgi:hypothetical protein
MGSNPVRGKLIFPFVRNFTLIAQYWLVQGMDSRVFNKFIASYTSEQIK